MGMQHLPRRVDPGMVSFTAIQGVTNHRVMKVGHMDPYLVGAPGFDAKSKQGNIGKRFLDDVGRARETSSRWVCRHADAMMRASPDRSVNGARLLAGASPDKSEILLVDVTRLELLLQVMKCLFMFGGNQDTTGIFIETVHDAGPPFTADALQVGTVMQQGMNQGPGVVTRGWMDDHAGRFVDDDDVTILIQDLQVEVFRHQFNIGRRGDRVGHGFAAMQKVPWFSRLPVHLDQALFDEVLPACT